MFGTGTPHPVQLPCSCRPWAIAALKAAYDERDGNGTGPIPKGKGKKGEKSEKGDKGSKAEGKSKAERERSKSARNRKGRNATPIRDVTQDIAGV